MSRSALLGLLALAACAPPEPGEPVAAGELCRAENEGRRVALEGHIDAGASIFCSNIGGGPVMCGLELKETPGVEDHVRLDVRQGGGGSEIEELPESWTREDLRIHAEDGSLVALADRVRVSGEANVMEAGESSVCYVSVDLIERVGAGG
jgi:hypothetical protein